LINIHYIFKIDFILSLSFVKLINVADFIAQVIYIAHFDPSFSLPIGMYSSQVIVNFLEADIKLINLEAG